jgi:hypothetical protein
MNQQRTESSFLSAFYDQNETVITVSTAQASRFAKDVAGDFNPIHDEGARRFCVPGDLLFALVLDRFGLFERMSFAFRNMVGDQTPLRFEEREGQVLVVSDQSGKVYLEAHCQGRSTKDAAAIEAFTREYVAFSGLNFPHYLKPLMEEHGVMFNPQRPLVIYDSMDVELDELGAAGVGVEFSGSALTVETKRAIAHLQFEMWVDGHVIGKGSKKLVIGGLRPYDEAIMNGVVEEFYRLKDAHEQQTTA